MKITVDQDKCVSSGQCVLNAADVFDQRDEDGVVVLLDDSPPADHGRTDPRRGGGLPGAGHPHRGVNTHHVGHPDRNRGRRTAEIPDYPMERDAALPVRAAAADAQDG